MFRENNVGGGKRNGSIKCGRLFHLFSAPTVVTAIVATPIIFIQIKCRVAEAGDQGAGSFTDHWYYRNLCKYS